MADGGYRGEQLLLAQVRSGQYKGETMQVYNYVGPLYGQPLKVGQRAVLLISTYSDGSHTATVYEYDRAVGLAVTVGLFLLATVLVGGKVGAKSLVALAVTLVCLFWILIPLLMKGAFILWRQLIRGGIAMESISRRNSWRQQGLMQAAQSRRSLLK